MNRGLPPNWAAAKFSDLYELLYGKGLTKKERNNNGQYPVYGSNGIVDYHDEYLVEGPAIVVGRKGAAGAVSLATDNCWPIDTTYYICDDEFIDLKFSFYLLTSLRLNQFEKSTAIPGISRDDVYDLAISLPPINEQHRIVAKIEELFSEVDKGIESLKTAREQLKVYRQAVLKHAFEGKLTAIWREENKDKLESADQLLARIQKERAARYRKQLEEWNMAVKAWEEQGKPDKKPSKPRPPKRLSAISDDDLSELSKLHKGWLWEKLGWMTCGVEYGTSAKSSESGSVPVVRMGNVQNAKIDWTDLVYTSDQSEIARYMLNAGDVLFNRTNSPELVGKTAIYRGERPAIFAGYLIRVNHMQTVVNSQYLNLFLNSHITKQCGNKVKTDGVNQSNINGEKLSNYPFPYCSLTEQCEVVRILDEKLSIVDQVEEDTNQQLQIAEALRQSILKKAFSGRLVEQDPSDEPASILLEHIKAEKSTVVPTRRKLKNKTGIN